MLELIYWKYTRADGSYRNEVNKVGPEKGRDDKASFSFAGNRMDKARNTAGLQTRAITPIVAIDQ